MMVLASRDTTSVYKIANKNSPSQEFLKLQQPVDDDWNFNPVAEVKKKPCLF